jgi:hypothetical protein
MTKKGASMHATNNPPKASLNWVKIYRKAADAIKLNQSPKRLII